MKEEIIKRLQMIETNNGGVLRPSDVVADAKKTDSPLHEMFDWNLQTAAEKHWMDQARRIITSVKVIIQHDHSAISVVYYVRDPAAKVNEQGYVAIKSLTNDMDKAKEVAAREFSSAMSALHRAKAVAMALGISPDLDDVLFTLQQLKYKVTAD
jgi:hypothetical protein